MKILIINAFYPPHHFGGYEMRCKQVVDGLRKRNHEVLVISTRCPDRKCDLHVSEPMVDRMLHQRIVSQSVLVQLVLDLIDLDLLQSKLKKFQPDAIYFWHLQNLSNTILPYFSTKSFPLVYDEGGSGLIYLTRILKRGLYFYNNKRDSNIKKLIKGSVYWLAKKLSCGKINPEWSWPENMLVYFNSHSSMRFSQEYDVPVANAVVIHSGIDLAKFPYLARNSLHSPIKIVLPGRITPEKGIKDAIYLVLELIKRKIDIRLRLVGKIQSEEFFFEIIEMINKHGLSSNIDYSPMVTHDDLAYVYQESDICFFPSYFRSGLSRVPIEAMASGCLLLTYGNEGAGEIIQHQETGVIVPEGDIPAAATMIEALIKDSTKYGRIIQLARQLVEREYTLDGYIDSIETLLSNATNTISQLEIV